MTASHPPRHERLRLAGEKIDTGRGFEVRYPFTGEVVATVPLASVDENSSPSGATRSRG